MPGRVRPRELPGRRRATVDGTRACRESYVLDGPMTGDVFRAYVQQMVAPSLEPGDVVVLDNLAAHKVAGVAEAIRAAGARLLYLPPYWPV